MELNWLKYFHEVAQARSVTLASQRLKISQPGVTKMIKQLEESLGYSLFRKQGRGIVLNAEGQKLFEISTSIFNRLKDVEQIKGVLDYRSTEVLRIGASDSVCNYLLPEAVKEMSKKFQSLRWSFYSGTSSEIKQRLLSGEIQYGIFYTQLGLQEKQYLSERRLGAIPFQLVYSPRLGSWKTISAINRANLHYVGARSADYAGTIPEQWLYHRCGIKISQSIEANSKEMQKSLVVQGLGFGIFPSEMVNAEIKAKKLSAIDLTAESPELSLVMRREETSSLIFQTFLEEYFSPKINQAKRQK